MYNFVTPWQDVGLQDNYGSVKCYFTSCLACLPEGNYCLAINYLARDYFIEPRVAEGLLNSQRLFYILPGLLSKREIIVLLQIILRKIIMLNPESLLAG